MGSGILQWKLRNDPRVVVMEGTNARYVKQLPELIQFVTIDASFISLKVLLPVVKDWLVQPEPGKWGEVVCLIKPQFEAGRKEVSRGKGVVRDPMVHRDVLVDVLSCAEGSGYLIMGLERSPILGPKGNTEFLAWLQARGDASNRDGETQDLIKRVIDGAI